jgi:two-component system, OmpR family, sensor kinase
MPRTLYARLVVVLIGFAVIMAAMFVAVTHFSFTARVQETNQKIYRTYAQGLVSQHIFSESSRIDAAAVKGAFERMRVINPRIDLYLLDGEGRIVVSAGRNALLRQSVGLEPVRQFLTENAELPILGDDPSEETLRRVFSVTPVSYTDGSSGYLYIIVRGLSGETLAQQIRSSYALRENMLTLAGGLLLALLASAFIVKFMMQRLQRLTIVMDKFRESGFAAQPDHADTRQAAHVDEVAHLTEAFNEMAERMLFQMKELQHTDRNRRELVANVSHDLRTPLASLQGHLETLQYKAGRLTESEKRSYLEIALRQSGLLSQLVTKLFELAKLDAERPALLPEPFVLADLVQDVVQQFELTAAGKGITLDAQLPQEAPLVYGDIGLIERALRNLIENSLRFTPGGGAIRVVVIAGQDHATVQVTDTGCGIDAADLPRIFDRFYRGEKSRSDSSGNAGLGLAITRRILELHGSAISVASQTGLTIMSFTLPHAVAATASVGRQPAAGVAAFPRAIAG